MIEPITAWWILWTFILVSTALSSLAPVNREREWVRIISLMLGVMLCYCLYILKGAIG